MKWEGLSGISFRMCISRVECKAAKKDLKLLKQPCTLALVWHRSNLTSDLNPCW